MLALLAKRPRSSISGGATVPKFSPNLMRSILLITHRWAGLTIALAMIVTGLTGAVLPFQRELREWIAPDVWIVEQPEGGARILSGIELADRVERQTGGVVSYIQLSPDPDRAQSIFLSPRPGGPALGFDQVFVDPYTADIRAKVRFADLRDGAVNVMPFLISFHYSLAAGLWGQRVMGAAALIWLVTSIVGLALTLPPRGIGFGKRWLPAWGVRRDKGGHALNYDLHRATGLWLFPVMIVFAWSAVAFNLPEVHEPVQRMFGGQGLYAPVDNPAPARGAPMSREDAARTGARLMAEEAQKRGFAVHSAGALSFNPYSQVIGFYARTSLDGPTHQGATAVWFDQVSGQQLAFRPPFGSTSADAVDKAFRMLHTAALFGGPYRIFVSVFGLLTAGMATAGVLLWLRRTGVRKSVREKGGER